MENSFLIASDASPGDVVAKLGSDNPSSTREIELLAKDLADRENSGNHPWTIQNGNDSTLFLFNTTSDPQKAVVMVANGRSVWQKTYALAAKETVSIGIRDLITKKLLDDKGAAILVDAWTGQITWFTAGPGRIRGRLLQSNRELSMARNFSCGQYTVICNGRWTPANGQTVGVGATNELGGLDAGVCMANIDVGCTGSFLGYGNSNFYYNWSTENPSIVTVSGDISIASVTGVAPGTAYVDGEVYDDYGCGYYESIGTKVPPTVTISGPTSMALTGLVTITATGSPTGGTYSWKSSNSNVSINQNSSGNAVSTTASSVGSSVITVTYTVNQVSASASQTMTIQECPTTLVRAQSFTEPLAPLVPNRLTGVGIIAQMQVGPSSTDWGLTPITESVSPSSNSCPASFNLTCSGNSTFSVGENDGGADELDGVPTPATQNAFYDNHTVSSAINLLAGSGVSSCSVSCNQAYMCGGSQIGPAFTITYSLTNGTVGTSAVTNVDATKVP